MKRRRTCASRRPVSPTLVREVIEKGNVARMRAFIERDPDVADRPNPDAFDQYSWTPVMTAARLGHTALIKLLLGEGVNVDRSLTYTGLSAIAIAVYNGHPEAVALLARAGANPNAVIDFLHNTPLHAAALYHSACIPALLDGGADRTARIVAFNHSPLDVANAHGKTEAVRLLSELVKIV